ncbi:hypothetical protein ACFSX9_02700 [Flavobacterium ardleyense]|uniref:Uncharacterized protein n=1 Tax=Flavobacterium ardleyense TaxID=2038737 RepID=A0ABW5Z485_9FLAO
MKIKFYLFIIISFYSTLTFGQTKSLRELLLEVDLVAITEKIPDPFYPYERKIALNDHQAVILVDSVKIISYLKKGNKNLSTQKFIIIKDSENGFLQSILAPEAIIPISLYNKQQVYKTILFAKIQKYFTEVHYFKEMDEINFTTIENFMHWVENTQKLKSEEERCKLYIEKYLSMLERNTVCEGFHFFENILLPTSNFMLYYKLKTPKAIILTTQQKERLKNYVFYDAYFDDIENTKLVYEFYPEETLEFYKTKLATIRTYDDAFDENPARYNEFLEFILKNNNKWNKDTQLVLEIIDDYYSNNKSLKREAFERLVEKINK